MNMTPNACNRDNHDKNTTLKRPTINYFVHQWVYKIITSALELMWTQLNNHPYEIKKYF